MNTKFKGIAQPQQHNAVYSAQNDKKMTEQEAARWLMNQESARVTPEDIRKMVSSRVIPFQEISGGNVVFSLKDLQQWYNEVGTIIGEKSKTKPTKDTLPVMQRITASINVHRAIKQNSTFF